VSQHGPEGDVTDALDVLLRGRELVVDDNAAPVVKLDTGGLEVEAFGVGAATDGDENDVSLENFFFATLGGLRLQVDLAVALLSGEDLGVELELEALLCKETLELLPGKI